MNTPTADEAADHVADGAVDRAIVRSRPFANAAFDLVALAASAGGLKALTQVLSGLPADFPAATVVVQHLDPRHRSLMVDILKRHIDLPVQQAQQNDHLRPGIVYIAPPNYHLLINPNGMITLTQSARTNFVRPSADNLFDSVAISYGKRAIAVILTGTGKDGALGIQAIKQHGGTVIAQDKATAEFFGMPGAAIQTGMVDFVLPLAEIAAKLSVLVMQCRE